MTLAFAIQNIRDFHQACDVPHKDRPMFPAQSRRDLRINLIKEETRELVKALMQGKPGNQQDLANVAKEIADVIVVCIGTALEFGLPFAQVWDEVHESNMSKIDPVTGKVVKRPDGKVLKGLHYRPPDILTVIRNAEDQAA